MHGESYASGSSAHNRHHIHPDSQPLRNHPNPRGIMPKPDPTQRTPICPYCGHALAQSSINQCPTCEGHLDPLSRQATQNHMGPWYIRDTASPFRPGCSYEVIRALAVRGKLDPASPVRSPTTMQFWRRADETRGLAHILGNCHNCRLNANPADTACRSCGASFTAESDRQHLGLGARRPLPGRQENR